MMSCQHASTSTTGIACRPTDTVTAELFRAGRCKDIETKRYRGTAPRQISYCRLISSATGKKTVAEYVETAVVKKRFRDIEIDMRRTLSDTAPTAVDTILGLIRNPFLSY